MVFFRQPLHWVVLLPQPQFSSSNVFPRCCFRQQAWAAALCYEGRSNVEWRRRGPEVCRGTGLTPETPRGIDLPWPTPAHLPGGPCNTATLLGLTCIFTRQEKVATSIMAKGESDVKKTSPILKLSRLSSTGCLQTPSSDEAAGAAAWPGHQFGFCRSQACTRSNIKQNWVGTYCHGVLQGGVHFGVPQVDVSPAGSPQ